MIFKALVAGVVWAILIGFLYLSYDAGEEDGYKQGLRDGWAQGHEKRLMQDMDRICI